MSKATGRSFPFCLSALVGAAVMAAGVTARADVSIEQSGAILVFPKVIANDARDTVVQISNTGNTLIHAHCFYTNAALLNPTSPPGPSNPPQWQETDFFLWLTRQQPTHWTASRGRAVNPFDDLGTEGAGLDPGLVPPVPSGFTGELMCVEVGADGLPVSGNHLKGEVTLIDVNSGDVSKYAGIAIEGGPNAGATGRTLLLDNDQYNSCPNALLLNHFVHGVDDPVVSTLAGSGMCDALGCPVETELTLIPCARDFENQIPGRVDVFFEIFDEFEGRFSTTTTVDCWMNLPLDQIGSGAVFTPAVLSTLTAYSRILPVNGSGGLLGVAEEVHHYPDSLVESRAAYSLQIEGSRFDLAAGRDIVDAIVVTGE